MVRATAFALSAMRPIVKSSLTAKTTFPGGL
jgi:hypothetical protein